MICRDGRVAAFDPDDLRESAQKRALFLLTPLQKKAGPEGAIDCQKFVDQFNKASAVSSEGYRAGLAVENFNLVLIYEPRHGGRDGQTGRERRLRIAARAKRLDPQKFYVGSCFGATVSTPTWRPAACATS